MFLALVDFVWYIWRDIVFLSFLFFVFFPWGEYNFSMTRGHIKHDQILEKSKVLTTLALGNVIGPNATGYKCEALVVHWMITQKRHAQFCGVWFMRSESWNTGPAPCYYYYDCLPMPCNWSLHFFCQCHMLLIDKRVKREQGNKMIYGRLGQPILRSSSVELLIWIKGAPLF